MNGISQQMQLEFAAGVADLDDKPALILVCVRVGHDLFQPIRCSAKSMSSFACVSSSVRPPSRPSIAATTRLPSSDFSFVAPVAISVANLVFRKEWYSI